MYQYGGDTYVNWNAPIMPVSATGHLLEKLVKKEIRIKFNASGQEN